MKPLRSILLFIGVVQAFFGVLFLAAASSVPDMLGLTPPQPTWVNWLFAMMGARFLGFAAGMGIAARDPMRHESWINTMIGVQILDWIATLVALSTGTLTLHQVTTAPFLPPLFVLGLLWWHPRRLRSAESSAISEG